MPEPLAPGVFVEETAFRSRSIEGVPTSTAAFVGLARSGPVQYPGGPAHAGPHLVTSFTEFTRLYGGPEPLLLSPPSPAAPPSPAYLAHAARAFFDNGGKRLYISRVFTPLGAPAGPARTLQRWGIASRTIQSRGRRIAWHARWPGADGNVSILVSARRGPDLPAWDAAGRLSLPDLPPGAVLELGPAPQPADRAPAKARLRVLALDPAGAPFLIDAAGRPTRPAPGTPIRRLDLHARITAAGRVDEHAALSAAADHPAFIGRILQRDEPADPAALVWLDATPDAHPSAPARLLFALCAAGEVRLSGGHDGLRPAAPDLLGPDAGTTAAGLAALADLDDVAIVAIPDAAALPDDQRRAAAAGLIAHAERLRYRFAVLDGPPGASLDQIRAFRAQFDSSHAALYHPWVQIPDPASPTDARLLVPPSGFIAGVYARSDVERGIHKAPANEPLLGLSALESDLDNHASDLLNPEGVNALRTFPVRGMRVWGARTISSDPEWKYVNIRRLFIYLERSIDRGTQWAVFEPNAAPLWSNLKRTIEDFLLAAWRSGALLGDKPEQAFFVRCDASTMTQSDLDNGRVVCLIGVAPLKPAEFIIVRIGQWTADAPRPAPPPPPPPARTFHAFNLLLSPADPAAPGAFAGFSDLSGLTLRPRASRARKSPGPHKHGEITLKRGLIAADDLRAWIAGPPRTVTITLLDERHNPAASWTLHNALPVKLEAPDLNAAGADVAIEELHLTHEGLEPC